MTNLIYFYLQDGTYLQKLVTPQNENGMKRTVHDLLEDFSTPVQKAGMIFATQNTIHVCH